jgi:hypothetical protein
MIRRFNYTGRQSILKSDAVIRLRQPPNGSAAAFDADLRLLEYGLPSDGRIMIEAYRQVALMEFPWGTVGHLAPPADRLLTEFDSPEHVFFRVCVISDRPPGGRLLAEADRIRGVATEESDKKTTPLLPVLYRDLGQELWRVEFTDRPRLLINKDAPDAHRLAVSPEFAALAYPSVLRQVLTRIALVEDEPDLDDVQDWKTLWLRFARQIPGATEIPLDREDNPELLRWIEEIADAFARQRRLLERLVQDADPVSSQ